jgi:hypothetical protein
LAYFFLQSSIHLDSPSQRPYTNKRRSVCASAALKDRPQELAMAKKAKKETKPPKKGK